MVYKATKIFIMLIKFKQTHIFKNLISSGPKNIKFKNKKEV